MALRPTRRIEKGGLDHSRNTWCRTASTETSTRSSVPATKWGRSMVAKRNQLFSTGDHVVESPPEPAAVAIERAPPRAMPWRLRRREADGVMQALDLRQSSSRPTMRLAGLTAARASARAPMKRSFWKLTRRPSPSSKGVYACDGMSARRLLWKSTSMSRRPASMRATSRASIPAGLSPNRRPPSTSAPDHPPRWRDQDLVAEVTRVPGAADLYWPSGNAAMLAEILQCVYVGSATSGAVMRSSGPAGRSRRCCRTVPTDTSGCGVSRTTHVGSAAVQRKVLASRHRPSSMTSLLVAHVCRHLSCPVLPLRVMSCSPAVRRPPRHEIIYSGGRR